MTKNSKYERNKTTEQKVNTRCHIKRRITKWKQKVGRKMKRSEVTSEWKIERNMNYKFSAMSFIWVALVSFFCFFFTRRLTFLIWQHYSFVKPQNKLRTSAGKVDVICKVEKGGGIRGGGSTQSTIKTMMLQVWAADDFAFNFFVD